MLSVFINKSTRLITPNMVAGNRTMVPILNGKKTSYLNLDNAASTPPFNAVVRKVSEFMEWYSNVHRGTGFKSLVATQVYEEVRQVVARFVKADPGLNSIILVRSTTEAINKLAARLYFPPDSLVITTEMEHHSNDLPWRGKARLIYAQVNVQGALDIQDVEAKLVHNAGNVRLLAVTGASNVTGYVNDIHQLARLAHRYGAQILVDAAQLAPHRPINMLPNDHPDHLDFVVFSGHKLYAPYGTGVLIGPREVFAQGLPEHVGGGTIELVTQEAVLWAEPPQKDEAGTPNLAGAVALAKALRILQEVGMEKVAEHECRLTAYALERMSRLPGLRIFGASKPQEVDSRVGVISFTIAGLQSALVAGILSSEGGIGVRNGCFCAHPYVLKLLDFPSQAMEALWEQVAAGDRRNLPGLVRVSFGLYNTREDVDRLIHQLERIISGCYEGKYLLNAQEGSYWPQGFSPKVEHYFSL
ncbi:MAG: aminotransferase class V-fold PLP-dependent enzyme [Carboxydocellales bacterium]